MRVSFALFLMDNMLKKVVCIYSKCEPALFGLTGFSYGELSVMGGNEGDLDHPWSWSDGSGLTLEGRTGMFISGYLYMQHYFS